VPHGGDTLAVDRRLEVAEASVEEAIEDDRRSAGRSAIHLDTSSAERGSPAAIRRASSTTSAAVFPVWSGAATT
jgi:hypothetical protein